MNIKIRWNKFTGKKPSHHFHQKGFKFCISHYRPTPLYCSKRHQRNPKHDYIYLLNLFKGGFD